MQNSNDVCYRAFELMHAKQYEEAEKLLNKSMLDFTDDVNVALLHSSLGVLFKLKGEPKTAWRHYQRAEKLIPNDPALKIIIARLLIEQFNEYDAAIKRAKKVLEIIPDNPVFAHQAYITMGLAYLGKKKFAQAEEMLVKSMEGNFEHFVTSQNIDFHLVEMLLRHELSVEKCREFLVKAVDFARTRSEEDWVVIVERMLEAFPKENQ